MVTHLLAYCGKDNLKKFYCDFLKEKIGRCAMGRGMEKCTNMGMSLGAKCSNYSYLSTRTISKMFGKKENIGPTWKILQKEIDLEDPTPLIDQVFW